MYTTALLSSICIIKPFFAGGGECLIWVFIWVYIAGLLPGRIDSVCICDGRIALEHG